MSLKPGQKVTVTDTKGERPAVIVCSYSSPFGPSYVVRYQDGSEGAVMSRNIKP